MKFSALMRHRWLIVLFMLFNAGIPGRAQAAENELETLVRIHKVLDSLKLGDSATDFALKIEQLYVPVKTNSYCRRYPFNQLMPHTNNTVISEWRSKEESPGGWPEIVFAVFSNSQKTNLVDALWFRNGNITPLVDGIYNRNLFATKPGDSMQKVYAKVGRQECTYFLAENGTWRVRFVYWGIEGRMFCIEADAASGKVVSAKDCTI